jgi:hypothetical protein
MSTIIPYIRGSVINFTAKGLKPFTVVYPFFDNQNVSEYCKMNSDVVYGGNLVTDVNGTISGQFKIPGGTFLTGTKIFLLTNDSTGNTKNADSTAVVTFTTNQSGIYESSNIISTLEPNITINRTETVQEPISSRQTFGISYKDPIAQTFLIQGKPHGVALTKMEVYFKNRPSYNSPITLQIRETIDGFPSDTILPYATITLNTKDVNVSDDATAPTVFVFPSPVYLKNNTEYAMVLIPAGDNYDYEVWVGRLGDSVVGGTAIIDLQPNIGTLFIPNNNASWTSYTDRDIKFTIYAADFNQSVTGTLELKNRKVDYITIESGKILTPGDILIQATGQGRVLYFNGVEQHAEVLITSGYFINGSISVCKPVTGTASGTTSSAIVTGVNSLFTNELSVNDILVTGTNNTIGTVLSVGSNTSLTLAANSLATFTSAGIFVQEDIVTASVNDNVVHVIAPGLSYLNFRPTSISWDYKLYDITGNDTTYTALPEISSVTYGERKLYSYSNELNSLTLPSTEGTLMLQASVEASTDNISPIVDVEKTRVIVLENYVDALTDELTGVATTSISSKVVTGASGSLFTTEVNPGAVLRDDSNKVLGVVNGVISDTSLELYANAKIGITTETITADNIASSESTIRVGQYITKNVELANNQDADDIIVYLNADIPPNTDVRVYVKLLSSTDTNGMESRVWTQLDKSRANSPTGFANWQYKLRKNANDENTAVGGLNSSNVFQYQSLNHLSTYTRYKTFAVKIAMITSNPAVVPSVFNMGVVALQA